MDFSQRKATVVAHHVDDISDSSDTDSSGFSETDISESSDDEPDESEQRPNVTILPSTTQNKLPDTPGTHFDKQYTFIALKLMLIRVIPKRSHIYPMYDQSRSMLICAG